MEIWKNLDLSSHGDNKYYWISSLGRVKSRIPGRAERLLTVQNKRSSTVTLRINGISKQFVVGPLVAKTFLPNPNNYKYVLHKDGNVCNNKATNIKWVEYREHSISQSGRNTVKERKNQIITLFQNDHTCEYVCNKIGTYYNALRSVCENNFV